MTRRDLLLAGAAAALRRENLEEAARLIGSKAASGEVAAAVLHVRRGEQTVELAFGEARTPQAVFLLASITKPMTATAVMILADRGALLLDDPVGTYIREFAAGERGRVVVRHLLTHTSGLPDMLPQNEELRKRHAPLSDFVAAACRTPLLFAPGTRVQYQSMGILLAGEIVQRVARRPLREFMRREIFEPLGMNASSLGLGGRKISETMRSQDERRTDWDWNSLYWRELGAPWGGAFSTAADVSRFLRYFVRPEPPILKPATAAAMIVDQNRGLGEAYGYGWRISGARTATGCSERTFGHSGDTGTLCWLDPDRDLSFVLLSSRPAAVSRKTLLQPASDLVSSAA